jgi:ApbE superfamily uncharacterized protein (UPF0280 family)
MDKKRFYRELMSRKGLLRYEVIHKETDLHIQTAINLKEHISDYIIQARTQIESYIAKNPNFLTSFVPLAFDPFAPKIVQEMLVASEKANVGPMAAVAGAIAEFVGKKCRDLTDGEIFIENGGDIYAFIKENANFVIYAGKSPISNKIAIEISKNYSETGVCTSSGTVGHSKSFGKADAVTIISGSATLSDAFATFVGNMIKSDNDIEKGLEIIKNAPEIIGGVIIIGSKMGAYGEIKILPV